MRSKRREITRQRPEEGGKCEFQTTRPTAWKSDCKRCAPGNREEKRKRNAHANKIRRHTRASTKHVSRTNAENVLCDVDSL